jgi:SET domain-containing protein
MIPTQTNYMSDRLEARQNPEKGGYGVFARANLHAGELLIVWGGDIVTQEVLRQLSPLKQSHSVQVEEGLYLVSSREPEPADYLNHSCNPNTGLRGQIALVALREIGAGEEICIDYAMCDGSPYDEFECHCGAPDCRGSVSGDDWKNPALWEKYSGYFSPYLQARIEALRNERQP